MAHLNTVLLAPRIIGLFEFKETVCARRTTTVVEKQLVNVSSILHDKIQVSGPNAPGPQPAKVAVDRIELKDEVVLRFGIDAGQLHVNGGTFSHGRRVREGGHLWISIVVYPARIDAVRRADKATANRLPDAIGTAKGCLACQRAPRLAQRRTDASRRRVAYGAAGRCGKRH